MLYPSETSRLFVSACSEHGWTRFLKNSTCSRWILWIFSGVTSWTFELTAVVCLLEKQKRLFDLDLLDFLDSSDANIFEKVLTTDVSFLSAAFEAGWFLSSFSKTIKVFITARHMQPTSFGLFSVCFVKMFWRGKNIETYFWGRFVWFLVVKEKKDYCSDYSSSDCCSCVLCCTRSSWCSKSFARLSRWGCSVLCSV